MKRRITNGTGTPCSKERGFTLIELLAVVSMVGILAAVVVPAGAGVLDRSAKEARLTEQHNVAEAVILMMTHNQLSEIPNPNTKADAPCPVGTNDLRSFPDETSDAGQGAGNEGGKEVDPQGGAYLFTGPPEARDAQGYVLFDHDITAGDGVASLFRYVHFDTVAHCYTADADSTVHQYLEDGTELTS